MYNQFNAVRPNVPPVPAAKSPSFDTARWLIAAALGLSILYVLFWPQIFDYLRESSTNMEEIGPKCVAIANVRAYLSTALWIAAYFSMAYVCRPLMTFAIIMTAGEILNIILNQYVFGWLGLNFYAEIFWLQIPSRLLFTLGYAFLWAQTPEARKPFINLACIYMVTCIWSTISLGPFLSMPGGEELFQISKEINDQLSSYDSPFVYAVMWIIMIVCWWKYLGAVKPDEVSTTTIGEVLNQRFFYAFIIVYAVGVGLAYILGKSIML